MQSSPSHTKSYYARAACTSPCLVWTAVRLELARAIGDHHGMLPREHAGLRQAWCSKWQGPLSTLTFVRRPLRPRWCRFRRQAPVLWAAALLCGRTTVMNVDETKALVTARAGPSSSTSFPRVQPRQAGHQFLFMSTKRRLIRRLRRDRCPAPVFLGSGHARLIGCTNLARGSNGHPSPGGPAYG